MKDLCFVLCLIAVLVRGQLQDDIVTISSGTIRGSRNVTGNIRRFLGVPFGETTAGPNRFQSPQAKVSWSGILNTTAYGPGCISTHHNLDTAPVQSEDCLNLNVYVPYNTSVAPVASLDVMVFFYGGGFAEGDDIGPLDMYDGSFIASQRDIIIVTANYRLGAYGFVVTDKLNGNYGLQDQQLALKWVQTNIGAFGGNNNSVTIFGESAGAMSVGLHLISPYSKGLFHRALMESNPVGMLYKKNKEAALYGLDFCSLLGCLVNSDSCDTSCMQSVPSANVTDAWKKSAKNAIIYILANWGHLTDGFLDYMPTIDGDMVPSQVIDALQSGAYSKVDMVIGTNTNEAQTFIYDGTDSMPMWEYEVAVELIFGLDVGTKILEKYGSSYSDGREALGVVFTDYWFRCPSQKFASAAVNNTNRGYVYRYNHLFSDAAIFSKFGLPAICEKEVCHASELPFVFHRSHITSSIANVTMTPVEVQLSTNMVNYWVNFAKSGDPNIGFPVPVQWPLFDNLIRGNIMLNDTIAPESSGDLCVFWDAIGYNY